MSLINELKTRSNTKNYQFNDLEQTEANQVKQIKSTKNKIGFLLKIKC